MFPVWSRQWMAMDDKIKLFQAIRKSYQAIGLDPIQSNPTPVTVNIRMFFIAISIMHMMISSFAFFIFQAKTIQEFSLPFSASLTELYILVIFFSLITKMGDISKLNGKYDEFIEKSKWKSSAKRRTIFFFISFLLSMTSCRHCGN